MGRLLKIENAEGIERRCAWVWCDSWTYGVGLRERGAPLVGGCETARGGARCRGTPWGGWGASERDIVEGY